MDDWGLDAAFEVYDSIYRPRKQEIIRTNNEAGCLYTLMQGKIYSEEEESTLFRRVVEFLYEGDCFPHQELLLGPSLNPSG